MSICTNFRAQPCFFLANNYVILSRLAVSLSTPASPVSTTCLLLPAQRIAKIFVWSDVITFWIQASGGGLSASNGLAVVGQKVRPLLYMRFRYCKLMSGVVDRACRADITAAIVRTLYCPPSRIRLSRVCCPLGASVNCRCTYFLPPFRRSQYPEVWHMGKTGGRREWRILFYTVCITCIGILVRSYFFPSSFSHLTRASQVRSAFRIAEFSEGYTGYIPTHEAYFYCLDSIPLLLAIRYAASQSNMSTDTLLIMPLVSTCSCGRPYIRTKK